MRQLRTVWLTALWVSLLAFGCEGSVSQDPAALDSGDMESGLPPGTIQYELTWDPDGITQHDNGWSTVTDMGYRVDVEWGYVVTYSVSLVPCPMAQFRPRRGLLDLIVPAAHAGHDDVADQSAIEAAVAESLTMLTPSVITMAGLGAATYCDAFILFARGDVGTVSPPEAPPLDGVSFTLRGRWTPPGGVTPTSFEINTDLARGELQSTFDSGPDALANAPVNMGPETAGIRVQFVRRLSSVFDGIEFGQTTERNVARSVLRNLTQSTRMTIPEGQGQLR